jgi:hypothetical protein
MRLTLTEMAERLGQEVPAFYREFVESLGLDAIEPTRVSPAEVCAVNLAGRADRPSGPTTFGFLQLSEDGDSWLVRHGDSSDALYVWSHETRDISLSTLSRRQVLRQLAATPIPQLETETAVSRVLPWTQSILQPILFEELGPAVAGLPAVHCVEYREGVNPLTHETFRIRAPGVAIQTVNGPTHTFDLTRGGLLCSEPARPLPPEVAVLAERLDAQVIGGL